MKKLSLVPILFLAMTAYSAESDDSAFVSELQFKAMRHATFFASGQYMSCDLAGKYTYADEPNKIEYQFRCTQFIGEEQGVVVAFVTLDNKTISDFLVFPFGDFKLSVE